MGRHKSPLGDLNEAAGASVAGPTLAAHAIPTGIVDEHPFANGMVYLRYHAWA
jgi:hypothetical protein